MKGLAKLMQMASKIEEAFKFIQVLHATYNTFREQMQDKFPKLFEKENEDS